MLLKKMIMKISKERNFKKSIVKKFNRYVRDDEVAHEHSIKPVLICFDKGLDVF